MIQSILNSRIAAYIALLAAFFSLASACHGQEPFESEPAPVVPHIEGPAVISLGQKAKFRAVGLSPAAKLAWSVPASLDGEDGHEITPTGLLIFPTVQGRYEIVVAAVDGDRLMVLRLVTELKGGQPPPVDPVIPPKPVDPVGGDLRVLMIYDSLANLNREQLNILNSTQVMGILAEKCVIVDGRSEWRKWDKDIDARDGLKNESERWRKIWATSKAALAKPGASKLPVLVIEQGTTLDIRPLPATEAATVEFLRGLK